MSLWWAGALLSMVGSICSNLGVNIQKFSFLKEEEANRRAAAAAAATTDTGTTAARKSRPYTRQPLWMLGLALVIFGSLGDFAALGLAAQSIVAPIGSITLVSNVLFAHFGLHERLTRRDLAGTVLILVGATLSVAFGNHAETSHTMDELKELYGRPLFISYACVVTASCTALYATIKKLQPLKLRLMHVCQQYELAVLASPRDPAVVAQLDASIAALERQYAPFERLHPFVYCALSGCLGAQSILFGKMLAEMITSSLRGDNQMGYVLTYVFLLCMLGCIFAQLHFLALGLSFFDALYVVPVFQCFFIVVSVVGGACYFDEFAAFKPLQMAFFPAGIALTLTGVLVLSSRKMRGGGKTSTSTASSARHRASTVDLLLLISDPAARDAGDEEDDRRGGRSDNLVRAVGGASVAAAAKHCKVAAPTRLLAPPADSRRLTATPDTDRTIDASIHLISGARSDAHMSDLEDDGGVRRHAPASESPVLGPTPLLREHSNDLHTPLYDEASEMLEPEPSQLQMQHAQAADSRVKFFIPTGDMIEMHATDAAASSRHRRTHSAAHGSAASGSVSAVSAAAIFMPTSSLDDPSADIVAFRPPPLVRTQSRFARRYSQLLDLTALAEEQEEAEEDAAAGAAAAGNVAPVPSPLHGSAVATARLHAHSRHPTLDGPSLLALMSPHHEDVDAVVIAAHRRTRSSAAQAPHGGNFPSPASAAIGGTGRKSRRSSLGPAATLWDARTAVLGTQPPSPPPPQSSLEDELLEL